MQTETISATGKRVSLTPNADQIFLNPTAPRLSVEYARARGAIHEDYKLNFKMNQAMAKRIRKETRKLVIEHLKGKVSKSEKTGKYVVTFPDNTVAVM